MYMEKLKQSARKLKKEINVLAVVYRDPRTPWYARVFIAVILAYSLSPIDLIPDFIPVLGYLDDLILIPLGIFLAIKMIPGDIFTEAHQVVAARPDDAGIHGWWFAVLIVAFWMAVAFFIIKAIWLQEQ
jgi:uncharacterized membrane protein YkvA (DUF1232 family)